MNKMESLLATPLLDSLGPSILRQVSEQGGYAYVALSNWAAAGDMSAAEAACEMAWEQLHCGPWHSVLPAWRDAYSMACLHVARLQFERGDVKECLRVLDLGIIMGGEAIRKDLDDAVLKASMKIACAAGGGGFGKDSDDDGSQFPPGFDQTQVLKALPPKSLSCKTIMKRSALSLEGFLVDYILTGSPVIISNSMAHWPAMTKWNDINYLKRVAGCRTVPVEVGKNYLCSDWKQELITFSQFLERIQSNECSSLGPTYLAQHQLFDQIQELRNDILVPDYCFAAGGELRSLNAWFGPAGTVTPLHHDPHHNLLAQVVGKKYIRLYRASLSDELYPHDESMLSNSSQVDLDNIDVDKFPKVQNLDFMDCVLEEGEMLYIPPKWWHYVRSLTISFSVSFWWSDGETGN